MSDAVWNLQVKEEQKQFKESTVFKAKPNVVSHKEPFQPKKDSRIAVGKMPLKGPFHYKRFTTQDGPKLGEEKK